MDLDPKRGIVVAGSDYGTVYALTPVTETPEAEAEAEAEPAESQSFFNACSSNERKEAPSSRRLALQRLVVPLYEAPHLGRAEMIQSIQVFDDYVMDTFFALKSREIMTLTL